MLRVLLRGCVVGLVLVWLAPFVSIAEPGAVVYRDVILAATSCHIRIPEAVGRVKEERMRSAAEHDAFEAFAMRLEFMDVEGNPQKVSAVPGRMLLPGGSAEPSVAMERVRDAYRETVMATPHYQEDYAESLNTNVIEEFGPDLATALAQGEKLTPQVQRAFIDASHTAARERASYQQTLKTEYKNLQSANRRLQTLTKELDQIHDEIHTPDTFNALIEAHTHVQDLIADCTRLLEDRQTLLADQPQENQHRLTEYLYREYHWTYPVLSDTLEYHTKLQTIKHKALQAITRHP